MFRRLFVGVALIVAFASLGSFSRTPQAAQASPFNQSATIVFADDVSKDGEVVGERVEFGRNKHVVWAVVDGVAPGANLSYILRLNGSDYKWGDLNCCKNSGGQIAFPLARNGNRDKPIPGGAYTLLVYDGDKEIARGGFGVNGGKGSDNDNDHN